MRAEEQLNLPCQFFLVEQGGERWIFAIPGCRDKFEHGPLLFRFEFSKTLIQHDFGSLKPSGMLFANIALP